ncbi:hypothetical protein [Hyphococcus sp.]
MSSMLGMERALVNRLVFGRGALVIRTMLGGMMNVFFCGVSGRDNADCAP